MLGQTTVPAPAEGEDGVFTIASFTFESGAVLEDMKVGYTTYGALSEAKDNAILVVPGTGSTRRSQLAYIGPGRAYDTDRHFVIAVDAIGGGTSSQPKDGLYGDFPRYGIRDMVRAQHRLVIGAFGLSRLKAVSGPSMGSFQALEWAINYPDMVGAIILMVPAARTDNLFATIVRLMEDTIALDGNWNGGRYSEPPVAGLCTAGALYFPWTVTDDYINGLDAEGLIREYEQSAASFAAWDAWSIIRRYQASAGHDVSRPFGGDMAAALGRIGALALVLPASSDRLLGVEAAREIAQLVPHAIYAEVPTLLGHHAWSPTPGSPETAFTTATILNFIGHLN